MLWYDGGLVEGSVAFDLADRGLLLGDGIFDTALAIDGRIAFEQAHRDRLCASARTLGFSIAPERVREAMRALADVYPRAAIRTTLTRGTGPRGLMPPNPARPLLFAGAAPVAAGSFAPVRLHVTTITRNETSPISQLKTLGYLDAVLATHEARAAGLDEALFLNTRGRVACAAAANLFALYGSDLVTPPVSDGVLPGIVRAEIIRLGRQLGLSVQEASLSRDRLDEADAVLLTNSLRLISPVSTIGERRFDSDVHPAFVRLHAALEAACREGRS